MRCTTVTTGVTERGSRQVEVVTNARPRTVNRPHIRVRRLVDPPRPNRDLELEDQMESRMLSAVFTRLSKTNGSAPHRWVIVPALVIAMVLGSVHSGAAQTVQGVVKDASSAQPIADASVVLLDEQGRIQRGTLSDPDGSYVIVAPEGGKYVLRVGAAGYQTTDSPAFEVADDGVAELSILLASEGETGPPGFDYRRRLGEGQFLTRDDIEKAGSNRLTEVLRFVPGVTVVPLPADIFRDPSEVARGGREFQTVRVKPDRATAGVRHQGEADADCVPVLFVDGTWWGPIDGASDSGPDGKFVPSDVEAIEIYNHPSILPDQFNSGKEAQDCGVVVLWLIKR